MKRIDTDLRQRYRDDNGFCEIFHLWPAIGYTGYLNVNAHDVHHISGGILGTPRYDRVTNLISLCRSMHQFCEKHIFDGFALCMAAKMSKGEWDAEGMAQIMHVDTVLGWLSIQVFDFEWTYRYLLNSTTRSNRPHDHHLAAAARQSEPEPEVPLHGQGQAREEGSLGRKDGGDCRDERQGNFSSMQVHGPVPVLLPK